MDFVLLSRAAVIFVLFYAGLAKVGTSGATAEMAKEFGLSTRFARHVGRWLAPMELLVAALLVPATTAVTGAAAALTLFLTFTGFMIWNLWQGRKPRCACFGQSSSKPISNWTIARNAVLVLLAATLLTYGSSESMSQGLLPLVDTALVSFAGGNGLAFFFLLQVATLIALAAWRATPVTATASVQPEAVPTLPPVLKGWPVGTLAPSFDLPSLEGPRVTLASLLEDDRAALLVFTSPGCRSCEALLQEIARWQTEHAARLSIALVSQGSAHDNRKVMGEYEVRNVLLQGQNEVATAYRVHQTPSAVFISNQRRVANRVAEGPMAIRQMVAAHVAEALQTPPTAVLSPAPPRDPVVLLPGDPAPPFKVPALVGGDVDLEDFSGRPVALIFWDPGCPHCKAFAPELLAREKAATSESAQMAFVSAGQRAALEAEGFASPVLLDSEGVLAAAYGSAGTPSALWVDAEGRVGSPLAVGATQINQLLAKADLVGRAARAAVA